jgi:hypothetical protein
MEPLTIDVAMRAVTRNGIELKNLPPFQNDRDVVGITIA